MPRKKIILSIIPQEACGLHKHPLSPWCPKRTRSHKRTTAFLGSLLRATPSHVNHGKMARFFGSMAGRAAGMRKALFTNGSGIKTLASAGVGCVGLQFNSGTRALTLSRAAPKGLETKFSYDGWHHDADEAEKYYVRFGDAFSDIGLGAMLDSMRRKQQLHSGDRSHPFIRKLDALTPTLSYDGWEKDARIIEWPGAGDGIFEGLSMDESDVDKLLARMRRKQAECDGDRSNKDLRELA